MAEVTEKSMRLGRLARELGYVHVAESLGLDGDELGAYIDGREELTGEMVKAIELMWGSMGSAVDEWAEEDEDLDVVLGVDLGEEEEEGVGIDVDGDGKVDFVAGEVGVVTKELSWTENQEERRRMLRYNLQLALITRWRLDQAPLQHLEAMELMTHLEIALIAMFGESVPEAGMNWDGEKRAREMEKRLVRLRWVDKERTRAYTGLRGFLNRLGGRTRVSGKELYQRMLAEAEEEMNVLASHHGARALEKGDVLLGLGVNRMQVE